MKRLWRLWYKLPHQRLYRGLKEGRGTNDNPLTWDDLWPTIKALQRIGYFAAPPDTSQEDTE